MQGEHGPHRVGTVQRYDRRFLVKSLREEYADSHIHRLQLRKEFKLLLELSHPGVVRVYELCDIPGVGYGILMEYVQGETLAQFLARKPGRRLRRRVAGKMMDALEYLHSRGVVHGDLKPSNIMVTQGGEVRLIDFGFGDAADYALLKVPGGTRAYSAPEQFEPGYVASPLADIYALGKILRELRPGVGLMLLARKAYNSNPRKRPCSVYRLRRAARLLYFVGICVALIAAAAFALAMIAGNRKVAEVNVVPTTPLHDTVYIEREEAGHLSASAPVTEQPQASTPSRSAELVRWDKKRDKFAREMKGLADSQLAKMREAVADHAPQSQEYMATVRTLFNEYALTYANGVQQFTDSAPAEWLQTGIHQLSPAKLGYGAQYDEMLQLVNARPEQ